MGFCTMPCCATCCLLLSGMGVVFLLVFGILLAQKSSAIEVKHEKMEKGSSAAFICAAVYGVFFVLSAGYLWFHARKQRAAGTPEAFPLQSMAEAEGADPALKPDNTTVFSPRASLPSLKRDSVSRGSRGAPDTHAD